MLKPQRERVGGRQIFSRPFAGLKNVRRRKRSTFRELFLSRLPAEKSIFSMAEQQQ